MPEATETGFLSIGEVLGLLLQEFPDITISKIRFLESQGLISPERTSSGYRKFYDDDVELLRVILTEQRRNYLPLRVIKDRLDSGEIDPTGEHLRPNGEAIEDDEEVADQPPTQPRPRRPPNPSSHPRRSRRRASALIRRRGARPSLPRRRRARPSAAHPPSPIRRRHRDCCRG